MQQDGTERNGWLLAGVVFSLCCRPCFCFPCSCCPFRALVLVFLFLQQFQIEREVNVIQTEAALLNNRVLLYMALGESF